MDEAQPERGITDDPHALQILATEHWSLLSSRSLAYNEAFTRANMFLTFVSLSFVGLALLAQAIGFTSDLLGLAAIVLAFDVIVGVLTMLRLARIGLEDLLWTQGMNRIRHAYGRIAPSVVPFFSTGMGDDLRSVDLTYGFSGRETAREDVVYGFSTSGGLVGVILALLVGMLAAVLILIATASGIAARVGAVVVTVATIALISAWFMRGVMRVRNTLEVRFPARPDDRRVDAAG